MVNKVIYKTFVKTKKQQGTTLARILKLLHKGPQYTVNLEKQPGKRSHELSGMGENTLGLPNMDHVMMVVTRSPPR